MSYQAINQNEPSGDDLNQMENGQKKDSVKPDQNYSIKFSNKTIRAAFVRKVFLMVFVMLCVVAAITAVPFFNRRTMRKIRYNLKLQLWSAIFFFSTYIILSCCKTIQRTFPCNVIFLTIFTLSTSFMTMVITAHYQTKVVLMALGVCIICTLTIIVFASQTKFDMTAYIGYICILSIFVIIFGTVLIFCRFSLKTSNLKLYFTCFSAFIMMIWLFYDVQMLMGGKKYELSPEDYIFASVQIFIDIVLIFLKLLSVFGSK